MSAVSDLVLAMRVARHGLAADQFDTVEEAVAQLVCVQAQDAPLARWSLGMRVDGSDDLSVRQSIDAGRILRTHILRPTWHFLLADDLHWIIDATGARLDSALASRSRQLALNEPFVERVTDRITGLLRGRVFLTRRELQSELGDADFAGERLGHVLMLGEVRGLLCSGPMRGPHHTYALVSERFPGPERRNREDAVRELAARFFAGHGPASLLDLTRWAGLTRSQGRDAIEELGDRLIPMDVDGITHWFDPSTPTGPPCPGRAHLLPVFDEAFLPYKEVTFRRLEGHPDGDRAHQFAESGGGIVLCDLRNAGWWKRTEAGRRTKVTLALSRALPADQRERVVEEAGRLAAFTGRTVVVELTG